VSEILLKDRNLNEIVHWISYSYQQVIICYCSSEYKLNSTLPLSKMLQHQEMSLVPKVEHLLGWQEGLVYLLHTYGTLIASQKLSKGIELLSSKAHKIMVW